MDDELEELERRMWEDMRRDWDYIDKIYVSKEEYERLRKIRLTEDELSPALEALFNPEKRMFLEDIVFIIFDGDDVERIIHLKYLGEAAAAFTVYDADGRLFGKLAIKVTGDEVDAQPDGEFPIGVRYLKRFALEQQIQSIDKIFVVAVRRMFQRLSVLFFVVLNAIHHVLNTVEVRQMTSATQAENSDGSRGSRPSTRPPAFRAPRRLHKIIYDGARNPGKRGSNTFVQHVDSWKVRGHWRTYSSGKRVWIKPHVKGRKSKKFRPLGSEYRL